MPTIKQKRVAKLIIENSKLDNPLNKGEIVEKSRYSQSMVIKPSLVLESEGVKQALADYGFSEDNAKMVVAEILLDKEKDANARLKASDQVFKVQGSYAPDKNINMNLNINTVDPTDETILQALKSIQDKLENE